MLITGTNKVVNLVAHRIVGDGRIATLAAPTTTNGLVMLRLTSQTDSFYTIQSSTNLLDWTRVLTRSTWNGVLEYLTADQTTNSPARFYRARWQPGF